MPLERPCRIQLPVNPGRFKRAATSEWVNAQARGRDLQKMPVRGLVKAKAIALWHAIAHNLTRLLAPPSAKPA